MRTLYLPTLHLIQSPVYADCLASLGLNAEDLALLSAKRLWAGIGERSACRDILLQLAHACADANAVPRQRLIAEEVATVIAVFVDPANFVVACHQFEGGVYSIADLKTKSWAEMEPFHGAQLLAHVLDAYENNFTGVSQMSATIRSLEAHLIASRQPLAASTAANSAIPAPMASV